MSVSERMQAILEEAAEEGMGVEMDMKSALPQLVLAMDAMGLDPKAEEDQDKFFAFLKKMATNKSALMKAMRTYSAGKATKAIKVAKAAI